MNNIELASKFMSIQSLLKRVLPFIEQEEKEKKIEVSEHFSDEIKSAISDYEKVANDLANDISKETHELELGKANKDNDELSIQYFNLKLKYDLMKNRRTAIKIAMKTKNFDSLGFSPVQGDGNVNLDKIIEYIFMEEKKQN